MKLLIKPQMDDGLGMVMEGAVGLKILKQGILLHVECADRPVAIGHERVQIGFGPGVLIGDRVEVGQAAMASAVAVAIGYSRVLM